MDKNYSNILRVGITKEWIFIMISLKYISFIYNSLTGFHKCNSFAKVGMMYEGSEKILGSIQFEFDGVYEVTSFLFDDASQSVICDAAYIGDASDRSAVSHL